MEVDPADSGPIIKNIIARNRFSECSDENSHADLMKWCRLTERIGWDVGHGIDLRSQSYCTEKGNDEKPCIEKLTAFGN